MEAYVEFKTWAEGPIETPWPFVVIDEVPEYRKRRDNRLQVDDSAVKGVFMSFDQAIIQQFLEENISGLLLGAIVPCGSIDQLQGILDGVFGFCEIVGSVPVTNENRQMIDRIMNHAERGKAPA